MFRTRRIAAALAALAASAVLALTTALPAFAVHVPAPGATGAQPARTAVVHVVTQGGMPGWQITLIAVGAALAAAILTAKADRATAARRSVTTAS